MLVCSGSLCLPVSHLGLCSPQGQGGSGLLLAPWALGVFYSSLIVETHSQRVPTLKQGGLA